VSLQPSIYIYKRIWKLRTYVYRSTSGDRSRHFVIHCSAFFSDIQRTVRLTFVRGELCPFRCRWWSPVCWTVTCQPKTVNIFTWCRLHNNISPSRCSICCFSALPVFREENELFMRVGPSYLLEFPTESRSATDRLFV